MAPMDTVTRYTFNACVVDKAAREVWLNEQLQTVAPRAFDLLLYLLEHRHRVATKDELIDHVWRGAELSSSAVASAVMKVRHAIGDQGRRTCVIRTVHRVGYRFVAPVQALSGTGAPEAAEAPAAPAPAVRLSIAVLPFENRTGERRFGWLTLGLVSLVNEALATDSRLDVAPVAAVLGALEIDAYSASGGGALPTGDPAPALGLAARMGTRWICRAAVSRVGDGFCLAYRLFDVAGAHAHEGQLLGEEPTVLCPALAQRLVATLFAGAGPAAAPALLDPRLGSAQVSEAVARSMQALESQQPEIAQVLIEQALLLAPGHPVVRRQQLAILAEQADPRAVALGAELLQETADPDQRAQLHFLLWKAGSRIGGSEAAAADANLSDAMRLTGRSRSDDWALQLHNEAAVRALRLGDYDQARALLEHVAVASEAAGNRLQQLRAMSNHGSLEAIHGNLLTARGLWERALRGYEAIEYRNKGLVQRSNLFEACLALGQLADGLAHGQAALAALRAGTPPGRRAACTASLCISYAHARRPDKVAEVIQASGLHGRHLDEPDHCHFEVALAQRDALRGDFETAGERLHRAIDVALVRQRAEDALQWSALRVHFEMRAGRMVRAMQQADALLARALPGPTASPGVVGLRLHAAAVLRHQDGDSAGARIRLHEALAAMPAGYWCARMRLDAAWLDIESGDLDAAQRVLAGSFSWLQSHPLGQLVDARLAWAQGRHAESLRGLKACRAFFGDKTALDRLQAQWQAEPATPRAFGGATLPSML